MSSFIFGKDRKIIPTGPGFTPVDPLSSPSMAEVSSSSMAYPPADNPADPSVDPQSQVNVKSSSMSPQPQAQPKPKPAVRKSAPAKTATPAKQETAPSGQGFSFTKVEQPQAEPELDPQAEMEKRIGLGALAEGTAQSITGPSQKYQTLFGWLTRRDPTLTPWTDFVLHGPRTSIAKSNRSDMEAAQLEQQVMRQQQAGMQGLTMPQVRLRQQMQQQWDKLLGRWEAGRFVGDEQTEQQFYDEANRLLTAMQNAGMDTSTLSMPSMNPGGFSQGYNKNVAEPLDKLRHLDSIMGEIYTRAANDPNWVTGPEATNLFDKLGELTIIDLAMTKGQIADAEKVRQQVAMMDPTIRQMYDNIMMKFFGDNNSLQRLAQMYQLDLSTRKTIEDIGRDLNGQNLGINDKPAGANIGFADNVQSWFEKGSKKNRSLIGAVGNVFNAIKRAGDNVPPALMAAFEAMKEGKDSFKEYVMQDAPVNMALIWELGERMRNENLDKYNDWTRKNGKLFGWKYRSAFNMPEKFGDELRAFQTTPKWKNAQAPVYNATITSGGHIPPVPGQLFRNGRVNNGGGTY